MKAVFVENARVKLLVFIEKIEHMCYYIKNEFGGGDHELQQFAGSGDIAL